MTIMEPVAFTVERADGAKLTLRGTRYLPDDFTEMGKAPVAVLFHGFGGNPNRLFRIHRADGT